MDLIKIDVQLKCESDLEHGTKTETHPQVQRDLRDNYTNLQNLNKSKNETLR